MGKTPGPSHHSQPLTCRTPTAPRPQPSAPPSLEGNFARPSRTTPWTLLDATLPPACRLPTLIASRLSPAVCSFRHSTSAFVAGKVDESACNKKTTPSNERLPGMKDLLDDRHRSHAHCRARGSLGNACCHWSSGACGPQHPTFRRGASTNTTSAQGLGASVSQSLHHSRRECYL